HASEPIDDLVDAELDVLAVGVPERHRLAGPHPRHRVVERVHEHPPAELAVGDNIEPALDLTANGLPDRLVLDRPALAPVPGALLREHRRMAFAVIPRDRGSQRGRPARPPRPRGAPTRRARRASRPVAPTSRLPRTSGAPPPRPPARASEPSTGPRAARGAPRGPRPRGRSDRGAPGAPRRASASCSRRARFG